MARRSTGHSFSCSASLRQVHFDALTSGLESETHFRVEEKQIIAGRYVVIQYLGSGTFCHTVQCEDLQASPSSRHRFVCVKVSKNTKDVLDQNLWEVKLLKLLSRRVNTEQRLVLPALLNVFYYRETLFIVYEVDRSTRSTPCTLDALHAPPRVHAHPSRSSKPHARCCRCAAA